MRRKRWIIALAIVVAALAVSWYVFSSRAQSAEDRAASSALTTARKQMVWTSGPRVTAVRVVRLDQLPAALAATAPPNLRQDVDVSGLIRRYGANRKVALVLVSGTYNSLPPDEGLSVNGSVVAIVDMKSDRTLLLTD